MMARTFSRIVLRSEGVKFVPNARVYYRVSPSTRLSYIGSSRAKMDAQFLGMERQIRYLRSVCDDDRTRAACTKYLETWMLNFYPTRPDIVESASALARSWGAELPTPRLSWKYNWIQRLFGWPAAKHVQSSYSEAKSNALRAWDRALLKAGGGVIDVAALETGSCREKPVAASAGFERNGRTQNLWSCSLSHCSITF